MLEPKGIKNKNISDQPESENEFDTLSEEVQTFWTPVKIKTLIGVIIAMSIVLALGFGFFIFKLVTSVLIQPSATKSNVTGDVSKVISKDESHKETKLKELSIHTEINLNGFKIQHIAATEKELILHVSKKAEGDKRELSEIWIFNKNTKKISGKIRVTK